MATIECQVPDYGYQEPLPSSATSYQELGETTSPRGPLDVDHCLKLSEPCVSTTGTKPNLDRIPSTVSLKSGNGRVLMINTDNTPPSPYDPTIQVASSASSTVQDCNPYVTASPAGTTPKNRTLQSFQQVKDRFSLLRKSKPKWPNPQDSVAKFCGKQGRYYCWEAKGPVQETFEAIGPEIARLLERSCEPVPASSHIIYDIFMVGETPVTSVPHIMFSCSKLDPRKAAMEALKKSGLLKEYPGIETGHWEFPPHIMDPRLLATEEETTSSTGPAARKVYLVPFNLPSQVSAFNVPAKPTGAIRLYTLMSFKGTVGSLAYFKGRLFCVSVFHAIFDFENCLDESLGTANEEDKSSFEFGGLSNSDAEFNDNEIEMTGNGGMTFEVNNSQGYIENDLQQTNGYLTMDHVLSALFTATICMTSKDLDYALIEPSNEQSLSPSWQHAKYEYNSTA
ncbi:hypothetical protein BP5796_12286 [Coleophoma crateriformis]|uniref:Uncharacterized protein n=1 Tax=Coleophoma crateriformis TaxID=565419 RepID=A0A3D8Q957_9HELO|nr:hypothetical protein BP5796_12286 [Coleophoma crateriformis]